MFLFSITRTQTVIRMMFSRNAKYESPFWAHSELFHVASKHPGARIRYIEESLNFGEHVVVQTTFVLKTNCIVSQWHIARLPPNSDKTCWAIQANTCFLCNAKMNIGKHGTRTPTYKGLKKEFHSTNNVEHKFWFCPNDIKRCLIGNRKKSIP